MFKLSDGKLDVIITDLTRPNGIAFSPDEKTLYVSNSDDERRIWMRYDIAADRQRVSNGRVFFDATAHEDGGVPDGMKIDVQRQYLGDRAERGVRLLARGNAPRHDQAAGRSRELRMGRRRPDAVHHGGNGTLSHQDVGDGTEARVLVD